MRGHYSPQKVGLHLATSGLRYRPIYVLMINVSLRSDPAKQRSCGLMLPKIFALVTPLSHNLATHDDHIWGIDVA
jgi:hypothetical protein